MPARFEPDLRALAGNLGARRSVGPSDGRLEEWGGKGSIDTDRQRQGHMTEDGKEKQGIRDGLRQGVGILSAFKEAIEETITEARERGDLKPERAKEAMKGALDKAQEAAGTARERFDFVTQKELSQLAETVSDLVRRVTKLEGSEDEGAAEPPEAAGAADQPGRESAEAQAEGEDTDGT